ncbi:hypothetical protein AVEN_188362-1 [Araneus ventricosus]|uniref:Uncharacterized protein n=1 Tax=Araneus ventricosus TaxID=182803 RepID=A0A4Y2Q0H8_ARAVE|nr:hypothetical protein AVEN_72806-1 [Araneus ventricosus]GBN56662.1 hypothetical protein AVEN_188362-1 [Araneus ventricosus]
MLTNTWRKIECGQEILPERDRDDVGGRSARALGQLSTTPDQLYHFEATWLFWDGARKYEPWSDDEDDTRAGTLSPNFRIPATGGRLAPYV